jgi:hypothetical protein
MSREGRQPQVVKDVNPADDYGKSLVIRQAS